MIGLTPDITEVRVVRHGVLALTFADGLRGEVAILARMRGPVFDDARTREGFAKVEVDAETGTGDVAGRGGPRAGHALRARSHGCLARSRRRRVIARSAAVRG
jgi:hypothetical protein